MNPSESAPDLISDLAYEFAERWRRGERPALAEYTERYPDLAVQIRELFPALVMMEEFGSVAGQVPEGNAATGATVPRQLGEYRILREIGRGGMGVVYEAVQESLGRHVALKVLPLHHLMARTQLERFEREAKAAARLHHTNIVPVFGIGVHEGVHYFAMQFIQGQAVDAVLEEVRRQRSSTIPAAAEQVSSEPLTISIANGLLTDSPAELPRTVMPSTVAEGSAVSGGSELTGPSEVQYCRGVARLGVQVAEALAYAHRQGIVHRDIKPSNILLDTQGIAWITDFGLVKDESAGNLTNPGDIVGTIRYMAPERFCDQGDGRCDVYSLGATLYEMLTLRPAFPGEQRAELIDLVRHQEPPRPRQRDRRIPRDLETVVLKAMAKEPGRRYPDAAAMADDLRRFLADRPVLARRSTALERSWRWCRRNRAVTLLGLSVFALLAVLLVGALSTITQLRDQLWDIYYDRAQASRQSTTVGRRFAGLEAVRSAAAIRTDLRLRNEAIALLTLPDVRLAQEVNGAIGPDGVVAFDDAFALYARSGLKGDISIRRLQDDQEVISLPGPGSPVERLRFSPDGRWLAARYRDERTPPCIWEWRKERVALKEVFGFFSPDSRCVVRSTPYPLRIYELASSRKLRELRMQTIVPEGYDHPFSPDGKLVAAPQNGPLVVIVDTENDAFRRLEQTEKVQVAWQSGAARLVTVGADKMTLWDSRTWKAQKVLSSPDAHPTRACFSPVDDLLLSDGDGRLRLWDVTTGRQQVSLPGALVMQWSRSGERIAATREGQTARIWQVARNRVYRVLSSPQAPDDTNGMMDFSADGTLLVTAGPGGVRLWHLATSREMAHLPTGPCSGAVLASDMRTLYTRSSLGVQAWPIAADGTRLNIGPPRRVTRWPLTGQVGTLVAAPDGRLAANLRDKETVALFDPVDPGHAVLLSGHAGSTNHVVMSPDGRWLAVRTAGDAPDKLRISDTRTGKIVWSPPCDRGGGAFSPDSRHLVTSSDTCCIWEAGSWQLVKEIAPAPGLGNVRHAIYAPDGVTLAIAYENCAVRLVDARSGSEWATLAAPELPMISRLGFSPDGSRLACLMDDVGVQMWDLRELRARLAELDLDWDAAPLSPAAPSGSPPDTALVRHNEAPPTPLSAPFDADDAANQQQAWARHLDVPVEMTNTIGMKMRLIPPGAYRPGEYASARGVSKAAFYLGTYELTVGQFRQFVKETGHRTSAEVSGKGGIAKEGKNTEERKPENIWSNPSFAPTDQHPVVLVSRNDIIAFCEWLSRKEGATYRLPTQDEWRWAALAGTPEQFHFGFRPEQVDAHYWHAGNSGMRSHAVGEKKPNPWGLFDMYGNAWEHVSDWTPHPFLPPPNLPNVPLKRPRDGDTIYWAGGGYWDSVMRPEYLGRHGGMDEAYAHFGFRVVLSGNIKAAARR